RDYVTELPISGALVQIAELGLSQTTDSNGYFEFPDLPAGEHTFITASFGYETIREPSSVGPGNIMLVHLNPMAVTIPGIRVEAERLLEQIETRRIMTGTGSTVFEEKQMSASLTPSLAGFVNERAAGLNLTTNIDDQQCVTPSAGSSPVRLRLFLDEAPVPSVFLDNLSPRDVALVEVFNRLAMIRIYTHNFVERAADAGYQPTPINLQEALRPC
ncbi:MAG: carboxypeptidase-like regulatory domain-containing protein, partial [Longimicrobiales bacterium]